MLQQEIRIVTGNGPDVVARVFYGHPYPTDDVRSVLSSWSMHVTNFPRSSSLGAMANLLKKKLTDMSSITSCEFSIHVEYANGTVWALNKWGSVAPYIEIQSYVR